MACSLRSTRVTGRPHYCGTVRHCLPRYGTLLLTDLAAWRSPSRARLSHRPSRSQCRGRSFPRSTLAPGPGSRRLYAGCRLGSKQVPPRLVPSRSAFSVSTSLESLSTRHQRFTCVRLPGSHLTPSWSAFSATFTTPAVMPAQLAAVWNLRLRGGSEGPTLIANAALLRVVLSTWDDPRHSWHNRSLGNTCCVMPSSAEVGVI